MATATAQTGERRTTHRSIVWTRANIVTRTELATIVLPRATRRHRDTKTMPRYPTGWEDQMLFAKRLQQLRMHDGGRLH